MTDHHDTEGADPDGEAVFATWLELSGLPDDARARLADPELVAAFDDEAPTELGALAAEAPALPDASLIDAQIARALDGLPAVAAAAPPTPTPVGSGMIVDLAERRRSKLAERALPLLAVAASVLAIVGFAAVIVPSWGGDDADTTSIAAEQATDADTADDAADFSLDAAPEALEAAPAQTEAPAQIQAPAQTEAATAETAQADDGAGAGADTAADGASSTTAPTTVVVPVACRVDLEERRPDLEIVSAERTDRDGVIEVRVRTVDGEDRILTIDSTRCGVDDPVVDDIPAP